MTIVYWRDIPAQVIASAGAQTVKRELEARFQQAIDVAAMRSGARDTEAYLADWRRAGPQGCGSDLGAEVSAAAAALEAAYDRDRLQRLIGNGGREPSGAAQTGDAPQ